VEDDALASDEEPERIVVGSNAAKGIEDDRVGKLDTTIKMRFLDPLRNPLSGVSVTTRHSSSSGGIMSGPSGTVELVIPVEENRDSIYVSINASLQWHVSYRNHLRVQAGDLHDLGEIVLEPAGAVSGRVIDRAGFPVAGSAIFYTDGDIDNLDKERARREGLRFNSEDRVRCESAGDDGTFRASAVEAGQKRIWAGGNKYLYSYSDPVNVVAGAETYGVEIILDARSEEKQIECVVLDPDGKPVEGAMVKVFAKNGAHGSSTNHSGRFKRVLKREGPYVLEATDPKGRYEKVRLEDVEPGTPDLILQFLTTKEKLRLLVSSREGESPGEFSVGICSRGHRSFITSKEKLKRMAGLIGLGECYYEEFKSSDCAENSTVSVAFPEDDFFVTVWAKGYITAELGPFNGNAVSAMVRMEDRICSGRLGQSSARWARSSGRSRARLALVAERSRWLSLDAGGVDPS